jgi:K+-transporting ATPase ATPase A chain
VTEAVYAFASAVQNNGPAFAGLAADTTWYNTWCNTTLGLVMLIGRFVPIILAPAIAGPTFVVFPLGVITIVGGLICFPMLIPGLIGERVVG